MFRSLFLFLFFITINLQPIFAQNQPLQIDTNITFHSKKFLGLHNKLRSSSRGLSKINIRYNANNLSSQISFGYEDKFTLDGSYLQYTRGITTFGVGSVDRHWSFSKNTSLILSHNARPSKSVYLKLKNKLDYNWLPSSSHWSLEIFNGLTDDDPNDIKPMILGVRTIFSPTKRLDFEFVQTSQWGGKGYDKGISALSTAAFRDTNDDKNANINKMAGFGISYLIDNNLVPLRIYAQAVGEDEAGSLPSCYAYLAGLEWSNTKIKYPTTLGIETVDTRIKKTSHGNCGSNTFYNNNVYSYTNYRNTIGAAIDTESTSFEFFGYSQLSQDISIKYSTKAVTINDKDWPDHRLSRNRKTGLINSIGIIWTQNNLKFDGNIYFQDFTLDKANIQDRYGLGISSSIIF
jgi:hypothetical protein